MPFDDFDPTDADRALAERLRSERPVPRPAFRGALRRGLDARRARAALPVLGWRWVALSSCSGVLLLAIAAVGLAGVGPGAA